MSPPFPTFLRWQLSPTTLGSLVPVSVTMSPWIPLSLRVHRSLYILVSSCDTFHVCKNTVVFYLMNGGVILEPILLLSGIAAPSLAVNLCFHFWESPWGWGPWSLWGLICISSFSRNSAWCWCRRSCPSPVVLKPLRGPWAGRKHTDEKQLREVKLLTEVFRLVVGTTN